MLYSLSPITAHIPNQGCGLWTVTWNNFPRNFNRYQHGLSVSNWTLHPYWQEATERVLREERDGRFRKQTFLNLASSSQILKPVIGSKVIFA